jgi:hypothetical protein
MIHDDTRHVGWCWIIIYYIPLLIIDLPTRSEGPRLTLFLQQQPLSCWIDLISGRFIRTGASLVSQLVQLVQYGPMLASECGYILFRITYRTLSDYIWGLFWARHHCGTLSSAVIPVCTYLFIQQVVYLMQSGKEGKELVCNNFHILSYMSIDLQSLPLQLNFKADSKHVTWCMVYGAGMCWLFVSAQ